jgi:hypothetical protein
MNIGDIISIHPHSDWFMRGIKFAQVKHIGRKWITLHSDMFNKTFKVTRFSIMESGLWNL